MIPELGQTALILAMLLASCQAVFAFGGAWRDHDGWLAAGRSAAVGSMVFCALAFGALVNAFVTNDFSVQYVATNSNTALPLYYRVAAVWGGHEGSLLLWVLVQSVWTAAVAATSSRLPPRLPARCWAFWRWLAWASCYSRCSRPIRSCACPTRRWTGAISIRCCRTSV